LHTASPGSAHATTPGPQSASHQLAPLEAAYVEQVSARLALYLGPIARIVTRKAAQDAKSRGEFLRRVADSLGTQERAMFLKEVGLGT